MPITGSQPAQLMAMGGVMRGATSRGNVTTRQVFVAIDGVHYATGAAVAAEKVLNDTLTITEHEGETPNTATFDTQGFQPEDGQDVIIQFGSKNNLDRLFGGRIMTDATSYVGIPANAKDRITALEYSWELTRYTITQRFTNLSATAIAKAIIALCPGWTSVGVAVNLPVVDEITFTNEKLSTALARLAERIGGYGKGTYHRDYRFGLTTDTSETDPTEITAASALLVEMTDFRVTRDILPVITRQPVEGNGSTALTQIQPGETILPVVDTVYFNASGGMVVSGPQRITYTGVQTGGAGSLVGPSAAPVVAPNAAVSGGGSVDTGTHDYAYVFGTAAGKSLPSPLRRVTTSTTVLAPPADTPTAALITTGGGTGLTASTSYQWLATYSTDATSETTIGPASAGVTADGVNGVRVTIAMPPTGALTLVSLYRKISGVYYREEGPDFASNLGAGGGGAVLGTQSDANLVTANVQPPGSNTATAATVTVSAIALGPTGTTYREVHRTAANGSQLKLVTTIANNTSTGPYVDTAADSALGANAPSTDTSGLTTVNGRILPGAAAIVTATAGPFFSTGGWVKHGDSLIRYAGITGNTLTGIPASGYGSIINVLNYGDHLDPAPSLTGVSGILYTIQKSDPVNLRVVVDDFVAQGLMAARFGGSDDGIIEGDVMQDGRINETEALARGAAKLARQSLLKVDVAYTTKDKNSRGARTSAVDLGAPQNVTQSFTILNVVISGFAPSVWSTFAVTASSWRFTFADLLRRARGGA